MPTASAHLPQATAARFYGHCPGGRAALDRFPHSDRFAAPRGQAEQVHKPVKEMPVETFVAFNEASAVSAGRGA